MSVEVSVTYEIASSGTDYGYTLSIRGNSHAWAKGELSRHDLTVIRDTIDSVLRRIDEAS